MATPGSRDYRTTEAALRAALQDPRTTIIRSGPPIRRPAENTMATRPNPARLRIERLRARMAERGFDAVLVPSSDPHLSEYLPAHWQNSPVKR